MVKGVQQSIGKMKGEFGMAIRSHIYVQLQDFIHVTLRDTLNKAMKHKKDLLVGCISFYSRILSRFKFQRKF